MWSKIASFLLDKDNHRFFLFVALAIAIFIGFQQCEAKKEFKQEVQKQKNNIEALGDSVRYYENEAGELTAEKMALQTDKEQIKTLNKELNEELKKERERVEYLSKISAEIEADSTGADSTNTSKIGVENWRFDWNLSRQGDEWKRVLRGYTEFSVDSTGTPYDPTTQITRDLLRLQLVTGIRDDNGKKQIFVRSTYPNLRVTDIQGAIIDQPIEQNPSRFGLGPSLGAGMTLNGFQPFVGISLNYNLIRF